MRLLTETTFWSEGHRSLTSRHGGGENTGTFVGSSGAGTRWKLHQAPCAIRDDQRGTKDFFGTIGRNITTNGLLRANAEAHTPE